MAKRHHESKVRKAEHMGMERYERGPVKHHSSEHHMRSKRSMYEGDYAGELARRTQEMEDAGMIHEDMRAIANLPQEVMIKPYANREKYLSEGLDDTIRGVDHQMDVLDGAKRDKNEMPKKV